MGELQEFLARVQRRIAETKIPTDSLYCVIERSPDGEPLTTSISGRATGALRWFVHGIEPDQEAFIKQYQEWERYIRRCWAKGQKLDAIHGLAIVYDEFTRFLDDHTLQPVSDSVFEKAIRQLGLDRGWPLTEEQERELARARERELLASQRSHRPAGQPDLMTIQAMYAMPTYWPVVN